MAPIAVAPYRALPYGVAVAVDSFGTRVERFETFEQAAARAARFYGGAVAVCKFSDGRWRPVTQ